MLPYKTIKLIINFLHYNGKTKVTSSLFRVFLQILISQIDEALPRVNVSFI